MIGISLGPPEMLQKPVLKKPSTIRGELENSGFYTGRPRGVNILSSEPRTKGLQSFYTWAGMIKQVCGDLVIAKRRTRVSEISSSS